MTSGWTDGTPKWLAQNLRSGRFRIASLGAPRRYSWAIMAGYRVAVAVAALVIATGCASRRPVTAQAVPGPPRVDDLTALIEQGCYRCLEKAYEQAKARGAGQQAFESAVLLVLRSKELGLPFSDWLAKARSAAPEGDASALGGAGFQVTDVALKDARVGGGGARAGGRVGGGGHRQGERARAH